MKLLEYIFVCINDAQKQPFNCCQQSRQQHTWIMEESQKMFFPSKESVVQQVQLNYSQEGFLFHIHLLKIYITDSSIQFWRWFFLGVFLEFHVSRTVSCSYPCSDSIQKVETAVSLRRSEQYLMKLAVSSTDKFSSSTGPVVAQQQLDLFNRFYPTKFQAMCMLFMKKCPLTYLMSSLV